MPALRSRSWEKGLLSHDFTVEAGRRVLAAMAERVGLPLNMSSYMYTFVQRSNGVVVFLGHPPQKLMEESLKLSGLPSRLLVNQEEMHDAPTQYQIWDFQGEIKTFPISTSLAEALAKSGIGRR